MRRIRRLVFRSSSALTFYALGLLNLTFERYIA
jgi:hypothetical protein